MVKFKFQRFLKSLRRMLILSESAKKEALIYNLKIIIDGIEQVVATNKQHHILSIANSIRTICHNSSSSKSILSQLNLIDTDFYSPLESEENLRINTPVLAWPMIKIQETINGNTIVFGAIPHGISTNDKALPFEEWWTEPVVAQNSQVLMRKQIILQTSNKLGGAHLDLETQNQAFRVFKEQAILYLGIRAPGTNKEDENVFPLEIYIAHIIQIGFEVVTSLRKVIPEIDDYLNENY